MSETVVYVAVVTSVDGWDYPEIDLLGVFTSYAGGIDAVREYLTAEHGADFGAIEIGQRHGTITTGPVCYHWFVREQVVLDQLLSPKQLRPVRALGPRRDRDRVESGEAATVVAFRPRPLGAPRREGR